MSEAAVGLILPLIIIVWGIGTTVVGLWFSYHNNFKQNTKMINLLEEIKEEIKNGNN